MFFNSDKETVRLYKRENERLKKELNKATFELKNIREYREKYKELIEQVEEQKEHYKKLNSRYENLIEECMEQLAVFMKDR